LSDRQYEFVGTTCTALSLDPAEFAGLTISQITGEILDVLAAIAPGVDFFPADIVEAANDLHTRFDVTDAPQQS
jgi:hypothetical protein